MLYCSLNWSTAQYMSWVDVLRFLGSSWMETAVLDLSVKFCLSSTWIARFLPFLPSFWEMNTLKYGRVKFNDCFLEFCWNVCYKCKDRWSANPYVYLVIDDNLLFKEILEEIIRDRRINMHQSCIYDPIAFRYWLINYIRDTWNYKDVKLLVWHS